MRGKKLAALFLGTMLAVSSLAGCGDSQGSGQENSQSVKEDDGTGAGEGDKAKKDLAETAIAERISSGNIPTLVLAFPAWAGRPAGTDRIQALLSEYTEEKIGVRVELEICDIGSYKQNMTLMLSGGEQIDIFNAMNFAYSSVVSQGYALNMDEDDLLSTYGAGIIETLNPDYLEACRINGSIYGVLQQRDVAKGIGRYCIPTRFLDGIGYDYKSQLAEGSDSIDADMELINDIFAQLHEAYPDKYVVCPNRTTHMSNLLLYDDIGNDTFGVLMDPANSLEVTNLYESPEFLEACKMYYGWNQKGYISKDALTDVASPQEQIRAGAGIAHLCSWKPGAKKEQEVQINEEVVFFNVLGDITRASAVTSMNWCINSGSEDPVAAMQLLNLLYTDPVAATILAWGEKGTDYVVTEDNFITFPEGIDSTTCEWSTGMNWLFPNQYITGVQEGNPVDIYEQTEKFNNDSTKSKALGFTFDNSELMAEYTALTNVSNEYIYQIILGFVEPEAALAEMNQKLYDAGLEKYMNAKQEALDQWARENGIQ